MINMNIPVILLFQSRNRQRALEHFKRKSESEGKSIMKNERRKMHMKSRCTEQNNCAIALSKLEHRSCIVELSTNIGEYTTKRGILSRGKEVYVAINGFVDLVNVRNIQRIKIDENKWLSLEWKNI